MAAPRRYLAGAYIPADVYVRYLRSCGRDVLYICGSDEHGTAIPNQALKEGTTPRAIIDKYHELVKSCFEKLGISFDIYHRTSEKLHHETSQEFFLEMYRKGLLTEETSEQYFDEQAGAFLADRYIVGTCPRCGFDNAYGDQCERCGSTLSPRELINPRSTLSGKAPVLRPTRHWYLPLQEYEPWLRKWILDGHAADWKPNVYGQCKSWLESGLQPRAMTRDLDWGVPVPLKGAEGKVLYVWFDAPIGYISATRQWALDHKRDWEPYWKSEDTRLIHFVGKDNIVFHCIIFPVMLHAHGGYVLPENVPANEFMNLEGDKMSTSRGWSVEMHEYLEDFPDRQDELRYCLLTNLPETKDSEFTWKDFQAKNNNELVAILGNFVNRALVLTQKHFDNKVPVRGALNGTDRKALDEIKAFPSRIGEAIEGFRFREATAAMMDLARAGNKYLADTEPWKLAKSDPGRMGTVLNIGLQVAANLSIVAEPFIPFSAARLRKMLNQPKGNWTQAGAGNLLPPGHGLGEAHLLFQKIEDDVIGFQIDKLNKKKNAVENPHPNVKPFKPEVTFDDFSRLDIRIGQVTEAERVEKSKKLLKLRVNVGAEVRTILSGIGEHHSPESLLGKQVTLVANLAPRKIMGIESQGMILTAEDHDGTLKMLQPGGPVSPGSTIS
jgi:methionyl-tRNA synthetase